MAEKTNKMFCSICLGDFSKPKLIDCHHCFCLGCLDGYVKKFTVNNHFPCPLCRRTIPVPAGGIKDFSNNFYIEESSCSTGNHSDFKAKDVCSNHHDKEADVYCKDCSVAVCFRCSVKNHNKHEFVDLSDDETFQQFCEELKTIKQDFINQISKFKNFSNCLELKVNEVSETADKLCSQIDLQILQIYEELKRLGEKTKDQVNDWRVEETEKLNALNNEMQTESKNVGEMVDNSDDILENKSFVQLIEIVPEIRKKQKKQKQGKFDIPVVKSVKFVEGKINSDILSQQIGILNRRPLEEGILNRRPLEESILKRRPLEEGILNRRPLEEGILNRRPLEEGILNRRPLEEGILNRRPLEEGILNRPPLEEGILNRRPLEEGILNRPPIEVGILNRRPLEEGKIFCFTTNFNVSQVKPHDVTWKRADGDDVIPWTVGVRRSGGEGLLDVFVKLDDITDKTIQRVDIQVRHKLINNNNDSQSVSREDNYKISPGGRSVDWCRLLVDYKTLNNKQKGFLDSNNNFTIQTTITITRLSR